MGIPGAKHAELYIGLLKEAFHKYFRASNAPMVLWENSIQQRASTHNVIPCPLFQADGQTPHISTFGVQGDISNLYTFECYERVYYREGGSFPENKEKIGRVLGPFKNKGNYMAQYMLNAKARVITRCTICKLSKDEIFCETKKKNLDFLRI